MQDNRFYFGATPAFDDEEVNPSEPDGLLTVFGQFVTLLSQKIPHGASIKVDEENFGPSSFTVNLLYPGQKFGVIAHFSMEELDDDCGFRIKLNRIVKYQVGGFEEDSDDNEVSMIGSIVIDGNCFIGCNHNGVDMVVHILNKSILADLHVPGDMTWEQKLEYISNIEE